jgi:tetratricopeptide (TPR) repeat protein
MQTTVFFLADLHEQFCEFEDAAAAYDKAIEIAPDEPRFLLAKAQLHFHHLDRNLGFETMMEVIKLQPDDAEMHYRAAAFMLIFGKSGEAMHYLQNGLELDYPKHTLLFDEYPEAIHNPRVMDLIGIYGQ